MNKADRNLLISIGVIIIVFVGGYASLVVYTGMTSPFSIVMSQSMQHDPDQSEIGSIDTGDIVIVRDPDKTQIQSYVEGTQSGYRSFGDYGWRTEPGHTSRDTLVGLQHRERHVERAESGRL